MSVIALPNSLDHAFKKLNSRKENFAALNRFLRSDVFSSAVINHRKQFTHVHEKEYRVTLEVLLSHYIAGESVGVNDLAQQTIEELDKLFEERRISKNDILKSFIQLLREVGVIVGDGRLTWAFLDAPSITDRLAATSKNFYKAYIQQTESEAALKKAYRDASALRKLELVTADNRKLQGDIAQQLDILKKEDAKCRERAMELGISYSIVKEDAMRKRKKGTGEINGKVMIFPAVIAAFVLVGFLMGPSDPVSTPVSYDDVTESMTYASVDDDATETNGLSAGENIWRTRYIELYKQNGNATSEAMESELFALSAEYMISMSRMEAIVATISNEDVQ